MTDTPETDDLARGNHVVPTEFAEHLERERDEWKAKYLQQNKDLGYELLDPNGTIWSECKRLQIELTAITKQRDRLAEVIEAATVLIAAKGRHNTMLAYNGLRDALQSTTLNKP
jgi:hypothetical protein